MKRLYLSFIPILVLTGCNASKNAMKKTYFYFDSFQTVSLYEGSDNDFYNIDQILYNIDLVSDNYKENSPLNKLNKSEEEIEITLPLHNLIKVSQDLMPITNGYFNPLVGSLSKLWKDTLKEKKTLSEAQIQIELEKINNTL